MYSSEIQNDINHLLQWSEKWQLPFNLGKCKVMHSGTNNPNHDYNMGDSKLEAVISEKDVGVTFDPLLKFKEHIRTMISKANSRVGIIRRTFSKLSPKSFILLYKSLVRPILEYCSSIWYPLLKTDADEIEKVQRRATKIVPSISHLSYPERLLALNIPTLKYRRDRTDMLQVFRIIHGIDRLNFDMFFEKSQGPTRGHEWKLFKPRATNSIRKNSFSHRTINPWNSLPKSVVECNSLNSFKNALEKAWAKNPSKYDPSG